MLKERIAVFGGTFNPIHKSHLQIAKSCLNNGYNKFVFLPSYNPPHKNCGISAEDRLNMIQKAIKGIDNVLICTLELEDKEARYTIDTLPKLKSLFKDFDFVIGGDSMVDLYKWKRPEDIIKLVNLVVVSRENINGLDKSVSYWKEKGANISVLDVKVEGISSSRCRSLCKIKCYEYVPEEVAQYIVEHRLYEDLTDLLNKLYILVGDETYNHVIRTTKYALKLNEKLQLDWDRVLLAALLHDCAKHYFPKENEFETVPKDCFNTPVAHQFIGKQLALRDFNVSDHLVLDAIECHCTAKNNMNDLEKLIFCADMLEEGRQYEGVQTLRELIEFDFETGFIECLKKSYQFLIEKQSIIYPLTKIAYNYYIGEKNDRARIIK